MWRRWDLHIHTPASHGTHYGAHAWEAFLSDLEALPSEISVLGISDYMWVDGLERVLKAKEEGRLNNIQAIFPIIELRLNDFLVANASFSRLNAHVIFAPGTEPSKIKNQFLPRLIARFSLTPKYQPLKHEWEAVATHESFEQLGAMIKNTVPAERLSDYGSDFEEGFNNWVISLSQVQEALSDSTFSEPPLLALGKTEWESIPWNDTTIASKKHLVSEADLLFTAAETPQACLTSVKRLREAGVIDRVLDCSDAHSLSTSQDKDRIGNSFTWICADPTLAGLRHALLEYDSRVFIGERPPLLLRQETDPTHFLSRIRIVPVEADHTPPPSFDVDLPLNPGFVAVIGNKGSGKSALLDSLALAGNSYAEEQFTFLSEQRYRNPRNNKAPHYAVQLEMSDGEVTGPQALSAGTDRDMPERLRYLPQSLLETLCNKEPGSSDDQFDAELRSIIFSHVPEHQRLGSKSLNDLLRARAEALDRQIDRRRAELSALNRRIGTLEERARPRRVQSLRSNLSAVIQQIEAHDRAKPPDPTPPDTASESSQQTLVELDRTRNQLMQLRQEEIALQEQYTKARARVDAANALLRELDELAAAYSAFSARNASLAAAAGIEIRNLARLQIDREPVAQLLAESRKELTRLEADLSAEGKITASRTALQQQLQEQENSLDEPRRRYQDQRRAVEAWQGARDRMVGPATEDGTKEYFAAQIKEAEAVPASLDALRSERLLLSEDIHSLLLEKVDMYRELYRPVQEFLESNQLARDKFSLQFEADLEISDFSDRFLGFVDRSVSGTFYGIEPSTRRVQQRVKKTHARDWESMKVFLTEHYEDLLYDRRGSGHRKMDSPSDALRKEAKIEDLYDFLFGLSYLNAEYELRSEGRSITELSPGQKGTILLMFYLLVDRSGRPIALDQPDENLDNHTIHTLLRPAIRSAKTNRQVFVITHSPNLAVVGDADQVIVAANDGSSFSYESGSIENPRIRDLVVRVLEGTWPAFTDRRLKYSTTRSDDQEALET